MSPPGCTDTGNAERLISRHGRDLRFVAGLGWHVWDGRRWSRDETGEVHRRAKDTVKSIYGEAARCDEPAIRKALADWGKKSESREKRAAMVALAQHERNVAIRSEQLDADGWAFNVANGTIDLRTGELRPHRREDLHTKVSPVVFAADAPCPLWDAFLARVVPDAEVRTFLQRFAGYSLTASAREHCLLFAHGGGRNGKGVLLLTLRTMLGDYAVKAPRGLLTTSRAGNEKHPTELMTLRGARMSWCSELNENDAWDESKVKDLASDDPVTAHYMRCDDITFSPTHKLWIAGNHKPRVRGNDEGIWSRLRLVPFDVTIPAEERDPELPAKLSSELPGILAWAIRGCLDWQAHGLGSPAAVVKATTDYRESENVIGRFIADRCDVGAEYEVTSSRLYQAFVAWCEEQGERSGTQRKFGEALLKRGLKTGRESTGARSRRWNGLRLANPGTIHDPQRSTSFGMDGTPIPSRKGIPDLADPCGSWIANDEELSPRVEAYIDAHPDVQEATRLLQAVGHE